MKGKAAHQLANTIRMQGAVHDGAFLLVEGRDDRLFLEKYVSKCHCNIKVGNGKQNVLDAIGILTDDGFGRALGVVDADFDRIEATSPIHEHVVIPEHHDMDMLLVCSSAFESLLVEFGNQAKMERLKSSVLDLIVEHAATVGHLRLLSQRDGLALKFQSLNYKQWLDAIGSDDSADLLVSQIRKQSNRLDIENSVLVEGMRSIQESNYDWRELCNGDDMIEILTHGIRFRFGRSKLRSFDGGTVRSALRLAFGEVEWNESQLAASIREWESRSGFQVLSHGGSSP